LKAETKLSINDVKFVLFNQTIIKLSIYAIHINVDMNETIEILYDSVMFDGSNCRGVDYEFSEDEFENYYDKVEDVIDELKEKI